MQMQCKKKKRKEPKENKYIYIIYINNLSHYVQKNIRALQ